MAQYGYGAPPPDDTTQDQQQEQQQPVAMDDGLGGGYAPADGYASGYADDGLGGGYAPDDGLGGGYAPDDGLGGGYPLDDGLGGGYAAPDDGLGGGYFQDDGLGGGYAAEPLPAEQAYPGDSAAYPPPGGGQQGAEGEAADADLADALDEALFRGDDASQGGYQDSQAPSRSRAWDDGDGSDSYDDAEEDGEETGGREPSEAPELDPAAQEVQRQNAWYKQCFEAMTEAQRNRLEAFNRSSLGRTTMKKVLAELTGGAPHERVTIAIAALTKMFLGELVETARQIAARQGHSGPLLPCHVRAAYQALSADGRVPHRGPAKPLRLR